jgi:hypothetical protein
LQFNIPRECASISRQAFRCVSKNIFRIWQAHTAAGDCYFDTVLSVRTNRTPGVKRTVNFWRMQSSYTMQLLRRLWRHCKRWYSHSAYLVFSTFACGRTPLLINNWPSLFFLLCLFFRWKK